MPIVELPLRVYIRNGATASFLIVNHASLSDENAPNFLSCTISIHGLFKRQTYFV